MRGEEIVGKTLYGPEGEEISSIKSIVVTRQGRTAALVVGVGGLLGLGEHQVAVPLDQVRLGGGDRLTTTLTKDALKSMPAYEEDGYEPADPSRRLDEASTAG